MLEYMFLHTFFEGKKFLRANIFLNVVNVSSDTFTISYALPQ
jgi:hypothetical protein